MKKIENHLRTNSPINHIFEFSSEFDGATGWDIDREYPLIETTAGGQGISDNDHEEEERRFLLPPVPITGGARRRVRMEVKMDTPSRELMPDQGSRCTDAFTIHSGVNFFHFGSINVSICNLSAATIAIGMLNMPYAMTISGLGFGTLCLLGGAGACIWSLYLLIETARACKTRSFNLAIKKSAGNILAYILDITILFAYLGYIIVFQIMTTNMMMRFLGRIVSQELLAEYSYIHTIIIGVFILYPLCIQKDMSTLSLGSFFLLLAIIYTTMIILFEFPFYFRENYKGAKSLDWFIFDMGTFDIFSYSIFAFEIHSIYFLVYNELYQPTKRRAQKIARSAIGINWGIYTVASVFGYLSTFQSTPHIVTTRQPLYYLGNIDYFMLLGQVGVYISLLLSVPLNYAAIRRTLFNLIWGPTQPINNPKNLVITGLVISLSTTVAILFPKLRSMITIIGGFADVIIVFIIPLIGYLMVIHVSRIKFWMYILFGVLLTSLGMASVGTTVSDIYNGVAT